MDLEPLRSFVLAVQLGSVTAAARAVGRSQPAVSVQIQGLEQRAGDRLLVREPRGVRPTKAGEVLYARAQAILREAEDLMVELQAVGSLRRGRLRVGATDVMAVSYLPRVLKRFRRRYPGIQLAVEVEGSRALAARVRQGDLDLGFVTLPLEDPELEMVEVGREPVRVVAAPGHTLGGRRVTVAELAQEPLIHHKRDSVTRREVEAAFHVHGLEPRVAMEVSSPEAIKVLVAQGLGIAPLALSQAREECRTGKLTWLRAPDFRCWRRGGVVRRRESIPLRVVSAFLAAAGIEWPEPEPHAG